MNRGLAGIVVRIVFIYVYVVAMMRGTGKHTIDSMDAGDFVKTLILSDMFDDIICGEVPTAKGVTGMAVLITLNGLVNYLSYKSARLRRVFQFSPSRIIEQGRPIERELSLLRISQDVFASILRGLKIDALEEVDHATIEPDGHPTAILRPPCKPAQKIDEPKLRQILR